MRTYLVPPDMSEKEKVVGGLFDLGQMFWLAAGGVLAIVVFLMLYPLLGRAGLIFAIPTALTGVPFVFWKPKGLTLYKYLARKREFKKKTKKLPFKRKNYDW